MSFLTKVDTAIKDGPQDKKETKTTGSNNIPTFQKGENIIAVAPIGLGSHDPDWAFETHFHWVGGETFVCSKKTPYLGDKYCPICTLAWSAYDQKATFLNWLNARKRFLMGVAQFTQVMTDTPITDDIIVLDAPVAVYESILSKMTKKRESIFKDENAKGLVSRIMTVDRIGEKIETKYTVELTDEAKWCIIAKKYMDNPISASPLLTFKPVDELKELAKQIAEDAKTSYGLELSYGGSKGFFPMSKGSITFKKDPEPEIPIAPTNKMDTTINTSVEADSNIPF